MGDVKISIIMPNYNSIKYLEQAINSFLKQDYSNKELIIVDGKSSDGSHEIIDKYAKENGNILWVKEKDSCVTDGFNIGLKYITGDFIGFMASDSIYYNNDVFSIINNSYQKIKFDSIYFDAYSYFKDEKKVSLRNCNFPFDRDTFLRIGCFVPFENIFFTASVYAKHQLDVHYNLASDIEFYLRIIGDGLLHFHANRASTVNIYDGSNLSAVHRDQQQEQWEKVDIKFLFDDLTPEKFSLHKSILKRNYKISRAFVKECDDWFCELLEANKSKGFYSSRALKDKYLPYWYLVYIDGRKLGLWTFFKFLRSPLVKELKISRIKKLRFFMACLIEPIKWN